MKSHLPCIHLAPCPKGYTRDLDKTMSPPQTIARVKQRLAEADLDILARRVLAERLGGRYRQIGEDVKREVREGLTVGTAESCTGGLVTGALTAVPGSSAVVKGGITSARSGCSKS